MNHKEALEYIHAIGALGIGEKLGQRNIIRMMSLLGDPHKKLKYVHVAGTNGKGSTAAFVSSILKNAGYVTGIFTSPYLEVFEERIRINGKNIEHSDLAKHTHRIKECIDFMLVNNEPHPTEFEIVTAIALNYFYEQQCDIVILEAGVGGRLDSTNLIEKSELSIITAISLDHTKMLGNTLEQIAVEKAGIIKKDGKVLLYPQQVIEHIIKDTCIKKNAVLHVLDMSLIEVISEGIDNQRFSYKEYKNLTIKLAGDYQIINASMAVEAALVLSKNGYKINNDDIRRGLLSAKWNGRMESLRLNPRFIIDGAHNEGGAAVLAKNLRKYFPENDIIIIMGVMKTKDYEAMLKHCASLCKAFIAITPAVAKALPGKILSQSAKHYCKEVYVSDTIKEAIEKALELSTKHDIICAFGSLYYIGEIRQFFKK